MKTRIYKVTQGDKHRLVRASNQAVARSHVARHSIHVDVATTDDVYELAMAGVKVEETSDAPVQKELGE